MSILQKVRNLAINVILNVIAYVNDYFSVIYHKHLPMINFYFPFSLISLIISCLQYLKYSSTENASASIKY